MIEVKMYSPIGSNIGRAFFCLYYLTQQIPYDIINIYQSNKGKLMVDQTREPEILEVQTSNKAKDFARRNTLKLQEAQDIYKDSKGLDNITEFDMNKFRQLMRS
jgi:hypothetical protein